MQFAIVGPRSAALTSDSGKGKMLERKGQLISPSERQGSTLFGF